MPEYTIEIPNEGTYRVESENELTDEQAWQAAQSQLPSGGRFAPSGLEPEGLLASATRSFLSGIVPAAGTALGAIGAGAIATPETFGAGTIPAAIAGGMVGGYSGKKLQHWLMGDQWFKENEAQLAANAAENPVSSGAGEIIPTLVSLSGGGGAARAIGARAVAGLEGEAAALAAKTAAAKMGTRIAESSAAGAVLGGSHTAQALASGQDVGIEDFADNMAKSAFQFGPLGVLTHTKTLATALGYAVPQAALTTLAGAAYDATLHGKDLDLAEITKETGANIIPFALFNAVAHGVGIARSKIGKGAEQEQPSPIAQPEGAGEAGTVPPGAGGARPIEPPEPVLEQAAVIAEADPKAAMIDGAAEHLDLAGLPATAKVAAEIAAAGRDAAFRDALAKSAEERVTFEADAAKRTADTQAEVEAIDTEAADRQAKFDKEFPLITPEEEAALPKVTQEAIEGMPEPVASEQIAVRPDLMQFKRMDEPGTGINQAEKIEGEFDPRKAGNLLLWEPANPAEHGLAPGQKYVVANGHHRVEFGQRKGAKGFSTNIIREADGFSAADARRLAAEINIADGKGTIHDQVKFIRNTAATHGADEALAQARRVGARGRKAAQIGLFASDPVYDAFVNERIGADHAEAIAHAAPKNEALQLVGLKRALDGADAEQVETWMALAKSRAGKRKAAGEQIDLFGFDDSAMQEMEDQAKIATAEKRNLREQIAAVKGAAKNPEVARKLRVNVEDPADLQKRIEQLQSRLEEIGKHPDRAKAVEKETQIEPKPDETPKISNVEERGKNRDSGSDGNKSGKSDVATAEETKGQIDDAPATKPKELPQDVLPPDEMPFNLLSETPAEKSAREARESADVAAKEAEAKRVDQEEADKAQGKLFAAPDEALPALSVETATEQINRSLNTAALPERVSVVHDPDAPFAGKIEDGKIVVNAARTGDPTRVVMEEGLHGIWKEPDMQQVWKEW